MLQPVQKLVATLIFARLTQGQKCKRVPSGVRKNNHSFNASCSCFHFMVQLDKGGDCMPFPLSNAILLIFGLFTYVHFRCGVYAYCRISKMSKSYIRKNTKGASNFWLYSQLHKQNNLGALYYLNLIYLVCLIAFVVALALSWISFLRIPVMIIGIILGLTTIPVFFASLIYTNIEDVGQPFVIFKAHRIYNGRRRFATIFDWIFCVLPLALYIFFLTR